MMWLASAWLACLAIILEFVDRAPLSDDDGTLFVPPGAREFRPWRRAPGRDEVASLGLMSVTASFLPPHTVEARPAQIVSKFWRYRANVHGFASWADEAPVCAWKA